MMESQICKCRRFNLILNFMDSHHFKLNLSDGYKSIIDFKRANFS
jgi:hypothetical protein